MSNFTRYNVAMKAGIAEINKKLGARIKLIRKSSKLTQGKLAERVNLSVEYISRLERGVSEPSFKTLQILAEALNVTVKDLLDFRGPVIFKDKKEESKQKAKFIDARSPLS
ncbi:MAG: helix-turn-helix transcriptional regulator [Nitrospirae bacterium]|nr:helix-turn-helix transcriptional regulator [Nitrospirota bacterium]